MTYRFDPELSQAAQAWPTLNLTDMEAARDTEARLAASRPVPSVEGIEWADIESSMPDASRAVSGRLYRCSTPNSGTAVLDIHGGGFVLGSVATSHARNLAIAEALRTTIFSVDYRLAPEHPYPAAIEDCYQALKWLSSKSGEFGFDPSRLAVMGGSAGAGLAAGLVLLARDRGGPEIAFQLLSVPAVDDRQSTASMTTFHDTPGWTSGNAKMSWDAYLGDGVPGNEAVPSYAAPARASDLSGLPPAYISAMQYDPLRDEGIAYALALLSAGTPVELHLMPGTFHGSGAVDSAVSRRESSERIEALRSGLGIGTANKVER